MTNYEANDSSSAPQTAVKSNSWVWLSDRLPGEGLEKLDSWLTAQLEDLELAMDHMVSPRSLQRDLRQQFTPDKR